MWKTPLVIAVPIHNKGTSENKLWSSRQSWRWSWRCAQYLAWGPVQSVYRQKLKVSPGYETSDLLFFYVYLNRKTCTMDCGP
jgi:hypothetical protein